jgi:hypothetical protein
VASFRDFVVASFRDFAVASFDHLQALSGLDDFRANAKKGSQFRRFTRSEPKIARIVVIFSSREDGQTQFLDRIPRSRSLPGLPKCRRKNETSR